MTRTLVAAVTLALLALMSWTAPAAADSAWNGEQSERIVHVLATGPTYVSPELRSEFSIREERDLGMTLNRPRVPVFLVIEPWEVDIQAKAQGLADHRDQEGYYLVVGTDMYTVHGVQSGMDPETVDGLGVARMAAAVANDHPELAQSPLSERLRFAIDLLKEDGAAAEAYRAMSEPSSEPSAAAVEVVLWGAGIVGVLALTTLVVWGVRRRSRRPIRVVPLSEAVLDTVDTTQREVKRDELTVRLTDCGRRVAEQHGGGERVQAALEAYEAAAKVMDSVDDMSDLVGVKVLLDQCEAALDGKASPGHCFFDPRHVEGTAHVRWRAPASFASVRLLACRTCRRAIREHRNPEAVTDSSGPRPMPYFAVPAERSVWAATGYGTLAPDLAARILRGELRS
ncbi:hypothetical protein NE857_19360 [Nocardiopsis exhalans]|uniref:MYXO-CTERM domain-containing protein n=1 Tax=Nocardiopsis exhalans TaxID=163604 RepID=A0ABY5D2Y2_9ACTN|nr:hypothetical protein [Nocardiopsis exhalans]USY17499.1 hypothetical protein NE857_19360 [Nocardiopsis exhalans]